MVLCVLSSDLRSFRHLESCEYSCPRRSSLAMAMPDAKKMKLAEVKGDGAGIEEATAQNQAEGGATTATMPLERDQHSFCDKARYARA